MFIKLHQSQNGNQVLIKIADILCIYENGDIGNADRAVISIRGIDEYVYVKETLAEIERQLAQNQNAFLGGIRQAFQSEGE